ncbi:hypothetical protein MMEU_2182 [Mycobacterium marinum str. Europe]|nr:hypothetical protein MMEU_2182 [Mycobacterium marinum str. Europe]
MRVVFEFGGWTAKYLLVTAWMAIVANVAERECFSHFVWR